MSSQFFEYFRKSPECIKLNENPQNVLTIFWVFQKPNTLSADCCDSKTEKYTAIVSLTKKYIVPASCVKFKRSRYLKTKTFKSASQPEISMFYFRSQHWFFEIFLRISVKFIKVQLIGLTRKRSSDYGSFNVYPICSLS